VDNHCGPRFFKESWLPEAGGTEIDGHICEEEIGGGFENRLVVHLGFTGKMMGSNRILTPIQNVLKGETRGSAPKAL
jgi:hypothetical protein